MAKEFSEAPEVEAIAETLIEILKPELEGFEIRYVFHPKIRKKEGRECIALARKVTGFYAYLAGSPDGFFVMEVGMPAYLGLTVNQKIAVIHHELCHFGISELDELYLIPHDIEEFAEVAAVHGAYFDRLQIFSDAVEKGNSDTKTRNEIIEEILKPLKCRRLHPKILSIKPPLKTRSTFAPSACSIRKLLKKCLTIPESLTGNQFRRVKKRLPERWQSI